MTQASIALNDDIAEGTVGSAMPPGFRPAVKPPNGRRARSLAVVVALHILLGWALMSGLARNVIEMVKPPLETKVVVELPPLPEPPPPPPPKKVEPVVRETAPTPPPPTFVPQAEVTPPVTAPAIAAVSEPPKVEHRIEAPAPPAPVAPAGPARQDIGIACPKQVAPDMPRKALQEGTSGTVKAQIRVVNGTVAEVTILSGPKVFHAAVRNAMMQYQCSASGEVVASQTFEFNVE